jgi:sugar phosphate isomerase/epimerase
MTAPSILFTKLFGSRPASEIGESAAALGFDGIDLLIRPGFTTSPDDPAGIVKAVKDLKVASLSVPNATTDVTDPARYPLEQVLGACSEAGIGMVRLGFWTYDGSRPYRELADEAKRHLDQHERAAERHGIKLTLQLHGGTIHCSGALAMRLLDGRDPQRIGAYIDPGNQTVQDGHEQWRLTFDLLGPWLSCVGVKNGGWFPAETHDSGQRLWQSDWFGVADGAAPWHEIAGHLVKRGYDGPLCFHGHYHLPLAQVLDQTGADRRYLKRLMGGEP